MVKWRRCLLFLFRQSAVTSITYPRLVRLLSPNFSEVGSNRRMLEEKAYRCLLKYMKEVAGKLWELMHDILYSVVTLNVFESYVYHRLFAGSLKQICFSFSFARVAGRRGSIKLENILRFTTCSENEPVLGYGVSPRIEFVYANSPLPTANTCINKLSLVIGNKLPNDQERMFEIFDLTFVNNHFGLV